jgi:FkbM family methyltransferase
VINRLAIILPMLKSFQYPWPCKRLFVIPPASTSSIEAELLLHGLRALVSPLTLQPISLLQGFLDPGFTSRDCLIVAAGEQLDRPIESNALLLQQLTLAETALAAKANVIITGTLLTGPRQDVLVLLKRLKGAVFLLQDRSSVNTLASLIGNDIFFFPHPSLFVQPFEPPLRRLSLSVPASQTANQSRRVAVNLSEASFQSLFDQHTDSNRRLFVALVLDQILCSSPKPLITLVASPIEPASSPISDHKYYDMAMEWLKQRGHEQSLIIAPSLTSFYDLISLFRGVDISIVGSHDLLSLAIHSGSNFLALFGKHGDRACLQATLKRLEAYPQSGGRLVSELYAISYELIRQFASSACSSQLHPKALIEGIAPDRWRSAFLDLCLQASSRSLQRLTPEKASATSTISRPYPVSGITCQDSHLSSVEEIYSLRDPSVRKRLLDYATSHFQGKTAQRGFNHSAFAQISLDGDPSFVPELLERDHPHEDDYTVFQWFRGGHNLILDIGANWGYSAASIWVSSPESHIVSFEAIPMYRPCLQALAELRPGQYAYVLSGLSAKDDQLTFSLPVVNHVALTALTTASPNPDLSTLIDNVLNHVNKWMHGISSFGFQFVDFTVPVRPLDDLIASNPSYFPKAPITAVKIDVEGMEYDVLAGGERTLSTHRPMIMFEENKTQDRSLNQLLSRLGYLRAKRTGSRLQLDQHLDTGQFNGYFVHHQRCSEYQHLGLLV